MERIANSYDLQYIYLQGNIGVMANGAGLAMATMDAIKLYGGQPANFLDIGGGATHEQIMEAIKILENDPHITSIVLNIFGGIMSCDKIAASIMRAVDEITTTKPIVLRLKGTHSDSAKKMIEGKEESLGVYFCEEMDKAAELAVQLSAKWIKQKGEEKRLL